MSEYSWFFQAFPLPSVKCILRKPAGSGLTGDVTAAALSPGRRLVLPRLPGTSGSPIGGCCLHVERRALGSVPAPCRDGVPGSTGWAPVREAPCAWASMQIPDVTE